MVSKPVRVRVRMYQVGFGDCILVSVEYDKPLSDGRAERHLLIDCGSTRAPRQGRARGTMSHVAELIRDHTAGVLDVLAVTHRHKDHVSGFGDSAGAAVMRELAPRRVLRPWTEDPGLSATADGPRLAASDGPGASSARFAALLDSAQDQALSLTTMTALGDTALTEVAEQLKNADAVKLLDDLSATGKGGYLYAGANPATGRAIPGLTITVLGPPTVEQDPRVAKQRDEDPEYWMKTLHASLREAAAGATATRSAPRLEPGPRRWLVDRLANQKAHSVTRLVRDLDDALNNTSLVLLLEVAGISMLFPGDAQIENWQYTLDRLSKQPKLKSKLAAIDLYKVGHHGSRNATPRSLHALWVDRPVGELAAIMSTRPGVHGESAATAVPRATLVNALQKVATLYSTDDLEHGEEYIELVADATRGPFRRPG